MKMLRVGITSVLMLVMLTACPKGLQLDNLSFSQRVDAADVLLTGIINATVTSLNSHQINSEEGASVRTMAHQAALLIDSARQASSTPEGEDNLALAIAVLQNLQTYLNERSRN